MARVYAEVLTHICAGNVSPAHRSVIFTSGCFNSYMRGECFRVVYTSSCTMSRFRFIYAWGMFRPQAMPRLPLELFQFIYVRGMFLLSDWTYLSLQVFQFIYVRGMFQYRPGTPAYGHKFQLIYVRGMFFLVCLRWSQVGLVSTHICAGNVSDCSGHYAGVCRCFNSYMRGECFPSGDLLMQLAMCFNSYMRGECFGES